jgi:photosystem II stability/assembly factor-like uncharacterized protein
MKNIFSSFRFLFLFLTITILLTTNILPQNYWERTSGPGTVTVYDFVFKDDFILAGTWHGGMYKSTDAGETWQHIENEFSSSTVSALKLLSNGNILIGTSQGIYISSDNGETWIYSGLSNYLVSAITIDELGSIYVSSVYGEDIYRSEDNGMSWNSLNSGISWISSITIKNLNTILVSSSGGIYRSSDRGISWSQVFNTNYWHQIIDVTLNSSGNFSAVSDFSGTFFLSTDEGVTWDSISVIPHHTRRIYSAANGDLYAGSYGVYRSTDEGQTWNLLNGFQGCGLVRTIAELGSSFFAGTYFSGVFRSMDYGNNWKQSSKGINHSTIFLLAKDFLGKVYAVSEPAGLAITTDLGENWEILPAPTFSSLTISTNGIMFGSIPGYMGRIFRSTDSGYDWELVYEGTDNTIISSVIVSPNATIFAIITGKLIRSLNNGNDWDTVQVSSQYESLTKININSQGIIFTKSSEGYFCSLDNGETWQQLASIPEGLEIFGITKTDVMYGTASDSGYYHSTDFGNSWSFLSKGNGATVRSFASNDIGYLFIVVNFGKVQRSTDSGVTWQEINSGLNSSSVNFLIITDDDYLLAGTNWGGVYKSTNKTTSVENSFVEIPRVFSLEQNFPNPFNPSTKIRYQISDYSHVSLKVYDLLGKEVVTLTNEEKPAGIYEIDFDGTHLCSGIYFYQLKTDNFIHE